MTQIQTRKQLRFRIWHLFLIVAIIAGLLWMHTQAGMINAEIEVQGVQFDVDGFAGIQTIHSLDFRFLEPEERDRSIQLVFLDNPAVAEKPIEVGKRIRFRYRAKSVFWLKQQHPNSVAIEKLGLDPHNVDEIISEIQMPEIDE